MHEHQQIVGQLQGAAFEPHFSVAQVAKMWNMSLDTVRRIFEREEGVVRYGHAESLHKRRYVTLSIPKSIVQRVHARLSKAVGRIM